jgi:Cu2+-exporting ATPase
VTDGTTENFEHEDHQGDTMKTSVIEVHDMLSVLSVDGVEERIGKVPGVESVTVNYAAGNATVRFDETRLEIADIRSAVRQGGYDADDASSAAAKRDGHEGHTPLDAPPSTPVTAGPKTPPASPDSAGGAPASTAQKGKAAPDAIPATTPKSAPGAEAHKM